MSGEGVQPLLARLLTEPSLLAEATADPESFAHRHRIDPAAINSLCRRGGKGVMLTAWVTRYKKFRLAEGVLPGTMALARDLVDEDLLYARVLARGRFSGPLEVGETGRRIVAEAARAAPDDAAVEVLAEMVRFETLWQCTAHATPPAPGATRRGPALSPSVRLATFDRPVAEVRRRLLAGLEWQDLPAAATHYALAPGSGMRVRVHRISPRLLALLARCDGSLTPARLGRSLDLPDATVRRALLAAQSSGLLIPGTP